MAPRSILAACVGLLGGGAVAFFFAFVAVFADGPGAERLFALLLTALAAGVAAALATWIAPPSWRWNATLVAGPSILLLGTYAASEEGALVLSLAVLVGVAAGSFGGAALTAAVIRKRGGAPS